jgi:hypothetical protein
MEKALKITTSQGSMANIIFDSQAYQEDKTHGNWVTWRCNQTCCHGRVIKKPEFIWIYQGTCNTESYRGGF